MKAVRREDSGSDFNFGSDRDDGVRAGASTEFSAEPGRSGELRFGDTTGGLRCEGESATVQECAGNVSAWV